MASSENQYKMSIGMESSYGNGGASFTDFPNFKEGIPEDALDKFDLPIVGGSLAQQKTYYTCKTIDVPLSFYLKGASGAGTVPELSKILRMAGMSITTSASTSNTWSPRSTGFESAGVTVNLAGVEWLLIGARVTELTIPLKGGEKVLVTGKMRGINGGQTANAYSDPTFADVAIFPPTVSSMTMTVGGNTHVIPELTLKLINTSFTIPDINGANSGISEITVDGTRQWGFDFLVQRDANCDLEFRTALLASTELAFASGGFGSAGGNKWDFDFANGQLTKVTPVYQFGRQYLKCEGQINYNATLASEFSMKVI